MAVSLESLALTRVAKTTVCRGKAKGYWTVPDRHQYDTQNDYQLNMLSYCNRCTNTSRYNGIQKVDVYTKRTIISDVVDWFDALLVLALKRLEEQL